MVCIRVFFSRYGINKKGFLVDMATCFEEGKVLVQNQSEETGISSGRPAQYTLLAAVRQP